MSDDDRVERLHRARSIPRDRQKCETEALAALDVSEAVRGQIAARAAEMPATMRNGYLRAMRGRSPRGAITAMCRMCCGWQRAEIPRCTDPSCPLYEYRPGR